MLTSVIVNTITSSVTIIMTATTIGTMESEPRHEEKCVKY